MKTSPVLALALAIGTCTRGTDDTKTCPDPITCAPSTGELRVATRATSASIDLLVEAFVDAGIDVPALRTLDSTAEGRYRSWDDDETEEAVVDNPLYEHTDGGDNPMFE